MKSRKFLILIIILSMLTLGITTLVYMNRIYSISEVYIARKFISEGTIINEDNFLKLIQKISVPTDVVTKLGLLESDFEGQKKIMGKIVKYNREEGDFIRENTVEIDSKTDPLKYKLYKLSKKAGGKMLLPIFVKLSKSNWIETKGIGKYQDFVRISFFETTEKLDGKKETKLITRYKNVPIIDFTKQGSYISSLVLALPVELAQKYTLEKRRTDGMIVSFNPFKYEELEESYKGKKFENVVTSSEIEKEYSSEVIYDLQSLFKEKPEEKK